MSQETIINTVMFSDVADTIQLCDEFGDSAVKSAIDESVAYRIQKINKHHGFIVEVLGDEILCRFKSSNDAANAACDINNTIPPRFGNEGLQLVFRIGLHHGRITLNDRGIYGDTVNIAARAREIAKNWQVILTEDTFKNLSDDWKQQTRQYEKEQVKGKKDPILFYETLCEHSDEITNYRLTTEIIRDKVLTLSYEDKLIKISPQQTPLVIGRSFQSDLVIDSNLVSRSHARIEYRHGKFIFIDNSTNGTFIRHFNERPVYLRRESVVMDSEGTVSFGEKLSTNVAHLVFYQIE